MQQTKLLHLADVHFDAPLKCKNEELRTELREATFVAFERAVSDALVEMVDAVVIAGDLFDGARISIETEMRVREQFERLCRAGVSVVIVSGNHDPSGSQFSTRDIDWPDNIRIVGSSEPTQIEVYSKEHGTDVPALVMVAAGHEHRTHAETLAARRTGRSCLDFRGASRRRRG